MHMSMQITVITIIILLTAACGSSHKKDSISQVMKKSITDESISEHISHWPADSKEAARSMMKKNGLPNSYSDTTITWRNIGPYSRVTIFKDPSKHLFPVPHYDVIEHSINYPSPTAEDVAKIWNFSGSVRLDRTMGMMSSHCDSEGANILALNLSDQIIKGEMGVEEARTEFSRLHKDITNKKDESAYLSQTLVFSTVDSTVGDPDKTIIDSKKRNEIQAEEAKH